MCRIPLPKVSHAHTQTPYAWYRPVRFSKSQSTQQDQRAPGPASQTQQSFTNPFFELLDFSPVDSAFAESNFALPFGPGAVHQEGEDYGDVDVGAGSGSMQPFVGAEGGALGSLASVAGSESTGFSWLLPGGNIPYYFPDQGV